MSRVRARRLTDKVTVWRKGGYDPDAPYTQSYTRVGVYPVNWIEGGGMQRDSEGVEFAPNKTLRLWNVSLEFGDKIAIGDIASSTPPDDAEIIRGKKGGGTMLIGGVDLTAYTG